MKHSFCDLQTLRIVHVELNGIYKINETSFVVTDFFFVIRVFCKRVNFGKLSENNDETDLSSHGIGFSKAIKLSLLSKRRYDSVDPPEHAAFAIRYILFVRDKTTVLRTCTTNMLTRFLLY